MLNTHSVDTVYTVYRAVFEYLNNFKILSNYSNYKYRKIFIFIINRLLF